ncbi:hypothetical protein A2716_03085 [candidate division WWE3 bacterium RIFCSPHIGHO2_01_FULL_40_23]|uniref:Uncharacterized protein n=1 Tax=candidate division WWE3 bacterium RIFCSPLOWO2_01_FULL_41_18 TaxID=1802625 RepID=A0A1F4VC37_UNCKA|nr:MAG: hypothetical protein A2716_03085 [candidate division WWE3 bacterium RIFCSPHIGHO2_01_FULL_40_23]OGC54812.1 MAG: hypothetical protein A3A78_05040 [candidate division WWE3 bacterium RIFCSPLOWO2_01_FULL_41_18]
MKPLKDVVTTYFNEENIVTEETVALKDKWSTNLGRMPLSKSSFFYFKPIPFIETDKKIFFDRRVTYLFQSFVSLFIGPLLLVSFVFIVEASTEAYFPNYYYLLVVVLTLLVGIINVYINNVSLQNILTFDKTWITEKAIDGNKTILKGSIPQGKHSYSLICFITNNADKLPLLDKLTYKTCINLFEVKFDLEFEKK